MTVQSYYMTIIDLFHAHFFVIIAYFNKFNLIYRHNNIVNSHTDTPEVAPKVVLS